MMLEYAEYQSRGGTVEENAFRMLEMRAEKMVDRLTHGRLRGEKPPRECVKAAVFALIGAMQQEDEHGGRAVQQVSNDGISVRYAPSGAQARYEAILREYLAGEVSAAGVGLLYAGVDA